MANRVTIGKNRNFGASSAIPPTEGLPDCEICHNNAHLVRIGSKAE
jgi:hypothetical protein